MKNLKWIFLVSLFTMTGLSNQASAQIASDNASTTNYPDGTWTNGSNGGTGFGPWSFSANNGTGFAGSFIGNPSNGGIAGMDNPAFGLFANPAGSGASVTNIRPFAAPLNVSESFSLQWGINWDGDNGANGNKGFSIWGAGTELIRVNNAGTDAITLNGTNVGFNYGTAVMTWSFKLISTNTVLVSANDRDGSGSFSKSLNVNAAPDAFSIYAYNLGSGPLREPYYNNFQIVTGSPISLLFVPGGSVQPTNTGAIQLTLERDLSTIGDSRVISLVSSNESAVTVPAEVEFPVGSNTVTFTATVVSLLNGSSVITATDPEFITDSVTINIPAPALSISGPAGVLLNSTNTYTVTRTGFVGNSVEINATGVPATISSNVTFEAGSNTVSFTLIATSTGTVSLAAAGNVATSAVFNVTVAELPPTPTNIYDDATFYPFGWSDGNNGGNGFGPWSIVANNGGTFIGNASIQGSNNAAIHTGGSAFGMWVSGQGNSINASRNFSSALVAGDIFRFSLAYKWDNGTRGFTLNDGSGEVFFFTINGSGFAWTGGGTNGPIAWQDASSNAVREAGAVLDVAITRTPSGFNVSVTSTQQPSLNIAGSFASGDLTAYKLYLADAGGDPDGNFYANKFSVTQGAVSYLSLTGPQLVLVNTTNSYTLTRTGTVANDVAISSTGAVATHPTNVVFDSATNTVTFQVVPTATGTVNLVATGDTATSPAYPITVVEVPPTPTNIYDDATFYPLGWTDGSNGGNGFTSWFFSSSTGGTFRGAAVNQAPNGAALDTQGNSFGLYAGGGGFSEASRGLVTPLSVGDVFTFSLAYRFADGNRGFDLFAGAGPAVFNLNISSSGYSWTGGGSAPLTPWQDANSNAVREAGVVLDVAITASASGFNYAITTAQDTNLVISGAVTSAAVSGFKFYVSGTSGGSGNDFFFNKLSVALNTTGILTLTGPTNVLDVATPVYTLTRNKTNLVGNTVYLSSSSPSVGTVAATVNFGPNDLVTYFRLDTLTAGQTTLVATNAEAASNGLGVTVTAGPAGTYDQGSFYYGWWDNGDNNGKGFGPWTLNHSQGTGFAGSFIGNPADSGIAGMDANSFGFYANPTGSLANAEATRTMPPLAVGEQFSFVWGINWPTDIDGSNRGFDLNTGTTNLLNINAGNSDTITINGTNMLTVYGTNAITLTFTHVSAGNLRVTATGRDGVESYSNDFAVAGAPDNFKFYYNANNGDQNRQMYANNFAITNVSAALPELPTNAAVTSVRLVSGQPNVVISAEAGLFYYLVYPTGSLSQVSVNPINLSQWGVAARNESVTVSTNITLIDTNSAAGQRSYGVLIRNQALPQ